MFLNYSQIKIEKGYFFKSRLIKNSVNTLVKDSCINAERQKRKQSTFFAKGWFLRGKNLLKK